MSNDRLNQDKPKTTNSSSSNNQIACADNSKGEEKQQ